MQRLGRDAAELSAASPRSPELLVCARILQGTTAALMVSQVLAVGPGRELIDQAFTDQMHNERRLLNLLTPTETTALETLLTTWLSRMAQADPAVTDQAPIRAATC
ncbi:hypothetical protein ACFWBS_54395 [Streptomyces mirabilis]|uniref:hypothetical protein n=1 Tax=Streptomyces mirabilis TaxID=68239 RepID=UPI0036460CCA